MKPYIHAKNSVKRYGGSIEDYIKVHDWFDSTKAAFPEVTHRAILHNLFGIYLAEQLFGHTITNSDGKIVQVRDIAEDHVKEDFGGKIPTIESWLKHVDIQPWMRGHGQKKFTEKEGVDHD